MTLKIKKYNHFLSKNLIFILSFLYPFFLFLPVVLGYKHFPYDFQGYNLPLNDSVYLEILNT